MTEFPLKFMQSVLRNQRCLVLDGALATELEARGANINDPLWSAKILIDQPELILAVHKDYFAAGADVATTASYQATFEGFAARGIDPEEARRLIRKSVEIACQARDEFWSLPENRVGRIRPLVAASVGPYGAMLADGSEYRGDYGVDEETLMAFHRPRLQVMVESGADLIAVETVPCLTEARAVARLLTDFPGVYGWISFSCRDGRHNSQGELFSECVHALEEFDQIFAVGVNCTAPDHIISLLSEARSVSTKALLAYPNSGESYDPVHKCWHGIGSAEQFSHAACQWHDAGARVIGGCCRTTPDDIRAVADWAHSKV